MGPKLVDSATQLPRRKQGRSEVKSGVWRIMQKLEASQKEVAAKDRKIFGLEVELAELAKRLDAVTELERELQHYRYRLLLPPAYISLAELNKYSRIKINTLYASFEINKLNPRWSDSLTSTCPPYPLPLCPLCPPPP